MVRRMVSVALAGVVVVASLMAVALLSEHQAGAVTVSPLVRMDDVVRVLREQGLLVATTAKLASNPRLNVVGEELLVNGESVVVYIFPSVSERAAADHLLRSQRRILAGDADVQTSNPRLVAARNVLLLHAVDDDALAALIFRAAGNLARAGAPS